MDIINHGELYHLISDNVIHFSKKSLKSSMSFFVVSTLPAGATFTNMV